MRLALALAAILVTNPLAAQTFQTSAGPVQVEEVVSDLEHPWSLAFLPSGDKLITERGGTLFYVGAAGIPERVTGAPRVWAQGQGGLLDVAVSPTFERDQTVFFTYAKRAAFGSGSTAVARALFDVNSRALFEVQDIFVQAETRSGGRHFGSRIAFAPNGDLFVTLGDRGDEDEAQNVSNTIGSVIRIRPEGGASFENPPAGPTGIRSEIWSYGHRNPQGAAVDPVTGLLWTVEHGARGGDEINQPQVHRNYGWPVISYGTHYSGRRIGEGTAAPDMEQPIFYWDPSIAPSGLAILHESQFPAWEGNLLVGALRDQMVVRLDIQGGEVVTTEDLFAGDFGRIRDVRQGPEGAVWFLTDEADGGLYRIRPVN
jgi:glucose/arabinose dehydrogenase